MSDYRYIDTRADELRLEADGESVTLIAEGRGFRKTLILPNADVPTVAAELLKAAGHDGLADLIGWESAEKKLQERRDALAAEFSMGAYSYKAITPMVKFAIDRIIELEDGK